MARWGKMTERGCYTLTEKLKKKLRSLAYANRTQISESEHVRTCAQAVF